MERTSTVLGIVGSPNRNGRTHALVQAALQGAAEAGASTELVQMADHVVSACKDCLPWVCAANRKCSYEDPAFDYLSERLHSCHALILGSPIYWWDTTGMVRYFFLKMFRVFARSGPYNGLPAVGIGVAGGTGNGLVTGLRPLYQFFQVMQMRAVEPLPVTRFDLDNGVQRAAQLGSTVARMAGTRQPFESVEERLLWYDRLPSLGLDRMAERRLLADRVVASLPGDVREALAARLSRADELSAAGRTEEMAREVTSIYDTALKAYERRTTD